MSDNSASGFGAFVPGFDFLQGLVKSTAQGATGGAPQGAPDWSKWVAPTLQADEIEKRIGELKTVQFWLEQNARALAATIQALEVQKMTLATLRGMNVQVNDLASAFGFNQAGKAAAERDSGSGPYDDMYTRRADSPAPSAAPAPSPAEPQAPEATPSAKTGAAGAAPSAVDPLQWWNALAGQFQQIAAGAMQEAAEQARTNPAGLQEAARQAFDAAGRMAAEVAQAAVKAVPPPAPARKRAPAKAAKVAKPVQKPAPKKTAARKPAAVQKPAARKTASRTR